MSRAEAAGYPKELVLPEPSPAIIEVQRILADSGFSVASIAYVDRQKREVTYAVLETIVRPDYTDGTQMYYENPDKDPLAQILERGRSEKSIAVPSWVRHVPSKSRFALSWDEIHNFVAPEVVKTIPHLAEQVTKGGIVLRVPTKAEFQFAGKEIPLVANSWEWLHDGAGFGCRLVGGGSGLGFLRAVSYSFGYHDSDLGFRLQAVSPSQKLPLLQGLTL